MQEPKEHSSLNLALCLASISLVFLSIIAKEKKKARLEA
jgi:hypothetical protein